MRKLHVIAAALLFAGAGCAPSVPSNTALNAAPSVGVPPQAVRGTEPAVEPEPSFASGVRGMVLLGATGAPYATALRIATKGGTPVKKFSSGADGKFAVGLLPGAYVVGPPAGAPAYPAAQDVQFVVNENAWTDVTVRFGDAGR